MLHTVLYVVFIVGSLLTTVSLGVPHRPTEFQDQFYTRYDYRNFSKLAVANQKIDIQHIDYQLLNAAIFYATNEQRALHQKRPLTFNPLLRNAATNHSVQMVELDFFSHQNSKNQSLRTLKDRINSVGGADRCTLAGENIAEYFLLNYHAGEYFTVEKSGTNQRFVSNQTGDEISSHTYYSFGEAVVRDWMTSPGHRANILDDRFTHLGCSAIKSTSSDMFPKAKVTQVFATMR